MKSWPQYGLAFLKQAASENLEEYYRRTHDISIVLHSCDDDYDTLTPPEISLRNMVVVEFVRGLREDWPTSDTLLRIRLY